MMTVDKFASVSATTTAPSFIFTQILCVDYIIIQRNRVRDFYDRNIILLSWAPLDISLLIYTTQVNTGSTFRGR